MVAKDNWSVFANPGLFVTPEILNSNLAGTTLTKLLTVKNVKSWSMELNPSPLLLFYWIPSTKISSPIENGAVPNPRAGVDRKQVMIPTPDIIVLIPTPLLLLIV